MTFLPKNKRQVWLCMILALIAVLSFSFMAYYCRQLVKPLEITVKSGPIGQRRTLKDRMLFVVNAEKTFHKKGYLASFDLEGENIRGSSGQNVTKQYGSPAVSGRKQQSKRLCRAKSARRRFMSVLSRSKLAISVPNQAKITQGC
jgi:hypothetical protein